ADFEALHEERYGHRDPEGTVEVVTVRVTGRVPGAEIDLAGDGADAPELHAAGWSARTDVTGTLVLERDA
ncbi:MAG: hypothetical protein ABI950_10235, partial [Solirubrobacteraceae bacterium]